MQTVDWLFLFVGLLIHVHADPALLGVSRSKGGSDLSGASFTLMPNSPGSPLSKVYGSGIHVSVNALEIAASRGVFNASTQGLEFKRGKHVWHWTFAEDKLETRRNGEVLLQMSQNERSKSGQFQFLGHGVFADVVLDKVESLKTAVNFCLADRALTSMLENPSATMQKERLSDATSYCKEITATQPQSVQIQLEAASKMMVSLSEQMSKRRTGTDKTAEKAAEAAFQTAITEKLAPIQRRITEAEQRLLSESERGKSESQTLGTSLRESLNREVTTLRAQAEATTVLIRDLNHTMQTNKQSLVVNMNETSMALQLRVDTLSNDVSNSIARANALFARLLVETNNTLSARTDALSTSINDIREAVRESKAFVVFTVSDMAAQAYGNLTSSMLALSTRVALEDAERETSRLKAHTEVSATLKLLRASIDETLQLALATNASAIRASTNVAQDINAATLSTQSQLRQSELRLTERIDNLEQEQKKSRVEVANELSSTVLQQKIVFEERNNAMKTQIDSLASAMAVEKQLAVDAERRFSDRTNEYVRTIMDSLEKVQAGVDSLAAKHRTLETASEMIASQLSSKSMSLDSLERAVPQLRNDLTDANLQVALLAPLPLQTQALQQKVDRLAESIAVTSLNSSLLSMRVDFERVERERSIASLQAFRESNSVSVNDAVQRLQVQIRSIEQELEFVSTKYATQQKLLDSMESRNDELRRVHERDHQTLSELTERNALLERNNQKLISELQLQRDSMQKQTERVTSSDEPKKQSSQQHTATELQLGTLRDELRKEIQQELQLVRESCAQKESLVDIRADLRSLRESLFAQTTNLVNTVLRFVTSSDSNDSR